MVWHLAGILLAFTFPQWPASEADLGRIRSGEPLHRDFEDGGLRGAMLRFFVRAEPDVCYRRLADVPEMPKYMPSLRAIRVVEDRGSIKVLEYKSALPLVPDFVLERHFEPPRRIWWTKVKAAYKRIEGSWDLARASGGTLVTYSLAVETGSLLPNWAAVEIQKQGGMQLVRNVTRYIESGGQWVRPDYGPS